MFDGPCVPTVKSICLYNSLLDVDEGTMLALMGDVNLPQHHIVHCREHVKRLLGLWR
jgi:hypothetical protein